MIDYNKIVNNLTDDKIMQLLDKLNIPYKETDKALIMPTVCHNVDIDGASWKLYYYKDNHLFYCYTSCEGMSIFKFLKNFYETRQVEYDWYNDIYRVILDCSNVDFHFTFVSETHYNDFKKKYAMNSPIRQLETYPNGILDMFQNYYPIEWLNDGITSSAMDKFNIRFSTNQNKIIIPHYNINNELVGIRGRALNEEEIKNLGKYMPVQIENKWYSHPLSLNLYGLNKTKENIGRSGICFLGEAEKFVLQMESFNRLNCAAAVCGSQFNKFQLNILMKHCHPQEIVLCFDQEEIKGQDKYFKKLWNICNKYKNYCNMSFIYDREGLLELKDSPTDKGEEIFEKLIERRIKVQ